MVTLWGDSATNNLRRVSGNKSSAYENRYAAGYMAKPAVLMRKVLSDKLFDKIVVGRFK